MTKDSTNYKPELEGRYLYCIINSGTTNSFGNIGIESSEVYSIAYEDIAAVVHKCKQEPYQTNDVEKAREWILAHNYVLDKLTEKFGTVLPFGFDTIIKGNDETIRAFLEREYSTLKMWLEKVRDRAEYGVQIFLDENLFSEKIEEEDERLKKIKEDIATKSPGIAFMLKKKLEIELKNKVSEEIRKLSENFLKKMGNYAEEIKQLKISTNIPDEYTGKKQILNLACLVHKDKVKELGEFLEEINKQKGFMVRFTGPWAPFNFVGEIKVKA